MSALDTFRVSSRRATVRPAFLGCLVAVVGCTGDAATGDSAVTDSAGVRITVGPTEDKPLPWRFVEERRLGGDDTGPASFTTVSHSRVLTLADSLIVVLHGDRSTVELFTGAGEHVRSIGGAGKGPGEFSVAFSLIDAGPDEVGVLDLAKSALVRWKLDGSALPERRLESITGILWVGQGTVVREGSIIMGRVDDDGVRSRQRLLRITPGDTTVIDSLVRPPSRRVDLDCLHPVLPPEFAPGLVWSAYRDRLVWTGQADYLVQVLESGRLIQSIRRRIEPRPTSLESADRLYPDGWKVRLPGGRECVRTGREVAELVGMMPTIPVLDDVRYGPDGSVWVQRYAFPDEPTRTDVFASDGRYLGTVTGRGVPLGWLGPDRVLFPITDEETGVSVIGIYRIDRHQETLER